MTLTELRYIVAVARERHFGRAAAACFVSQPTLSVAIKKLEDELGVALFERGKNDVRVTPVGERIVAQARLVLEEVEGVKRIAKQEQDQLDGPLRLGAIYTVAPYLLPQLIPVLHKQAPKMPLVIEENYTARLQERLLQGDLDVIIISLPFAEPGVTVRALYDEPFMVVLPASHPWRERAAIAVKELAEEPVLMLGAGHCFREQLLSACPDCQRAVAADDPLGRAMEGGSLETIRHMVASGLGITVMPCTATGADRYAQRLLVLKRFKPPVPKRRVALAWRNGFYRPQAVAVLAKAIRACKLSCVVPVGK
jgi:LysR family hydrogen peroxide-inducible transcriptional activator